MSKECPKCHKILEDNAKFCSECGWQFHQKTNHPKQRRWEIKKFSDCSFDTVADWIKSNNGHIEILDAKGNIKYDTSGFIFINREWYVQYLNIRYYNDAQANKQYAIVRAEAYDKLFSSGAKRAQEQVKNMVQNRNVIFHISRRSHFSGGGSREFCCTAAIYEI